MFKSAKSSNTGLDIWIQFQSDNIVSNKYLVLVRSSYHCFKWPLCVLIQSLSDFSLSLMFSLLNRLSHVSPNAFPKICWNAQMWMTISDYKIWFILFDKISTNHATNNTSTITSKIYAVHQRAGSFIIYPLLDVQWYCWLATLIETFLLILLISFHIQQEIWSAIHEFNCTKYNTLHRYKEINQTTELMLWKWPRPVTSSFL